MNEFDLEQYRTAWQKGQDFSAQPLGPAGIEAVLKKESGNITRQFRTGLYTDIALKGLLLLAMAGLQFLFWNHAAVAWINASILAFTVLGLVYQWNTLSQVPGPEVAGGSLREGLREMIRFCRGRFDHALLVAATSGSLVFYTGVLFYSGLRYGGIRPLQWDDFLVFGTGLLLAFGINLLAQRWQMAFHIRELEYCLQEIDKESLTALDLRKQRHRRVRVTMMWAVWAVLGILLLSYFLAR